jgi:hypothetical protein
MAPAFPDGAAIVFGARPTLRLKKAPARPPAAAPTIAVVQTFRSLFTASSNAFNPRNTPAPKPAAAPITVHAIRFPDDRVDDGD